MSFISSTLFEGTDFKCEKGTGNRTRLYIIRPNVFDIVKCSDEIRVCFADGRTYTMGFATTSKNGSYVDCYLM